MPSWRQSLESLLACSALRTVASKRTLNVSDTLVKNLLEGLGVGVILLNLGNDGLGKLALLPLLDLALVADPRVEHRLGLGGNGSLLLELKGLGLELGSLLWDNGQPTAPPCPMSNQRTLETSKSVLVTSMTLLRSWTLSMRCLTAWVWSWRAELRMPEILSTCCCA